ncbi:MAG: glycosyltransferase [Tissierellia bacterium]|nr:glycosyltransferase [Tissierellia bacterium]
MKVLILSQGIPNSKYPMNGIHQFAYAKALKKKGIDVIVAAHDIRSIYRLRKPGFIKTEYDGIRTYLQNQFIETNHRMKAGAKAIKGFRKLYHRIKEEEQFDLIHGHFYEYTYGAAMLEEREEPLIISEHSSSINKDSLEDMRKDYYDLAKKTYENCDGIIVGSPFFQKRMEKNFGVQATVLPTIINDDVFYLGKEKADFFKIVSTGNLIEAKGHREMIEAFHQYFSDIDAKLYIIGSGPDQKYLEEMIEKRNLKDSVILLGQCSREEIANEYANAHIFALASRTETYGKVYVEAMAAGLPVLTVNNGGSEHFIRSFNGKIAKVSDVKSLGINLLDMYQNYDGYDCEKIQAFEQEEFSESVAVDKLVELYDKILNKQYEVR